METIDLFYEPALRAIEIAGVGPGWHCADIGSGTGSIAQYLAQRVGETGRIYAVDQDPAARDAVAELAARHTQVVSLTQSVEELTLPEAVDLAWCRFLLLHVFDPREALAAMIKAVKPGSWIVLEEPITSAGRIDGQALSMPDARHPDIGESLPGLVKSFGCDIVEAWAYAPVGAGEGAVRDEFEDLTGVSLGDESIVLSPLVTVVARTPS